MKRASGEGTIRKRPDGLWEARLSVPGRKPKSFYGKTQAEALRKRAEAKRALEDGLSFDSREQTVGHYLERWLDGPLKQTVWISTYEDYAWICRKHLIPEIGHIKLSRLTAEDLDYLYAKKIASGLGPSTVDRIHSVIRVALGRAVKKRLIPFNVARDAEPPAKVKKEVKTLSKEDLAAFFAAAKGDRFEACFIMAALTGMRPGELLALKWPDLKLPEDPSEPGEVRVRRSVSKTENGPVFRETTKTGKGRVIHLLAEVVAALKEHRKRQLEERLQYAGLWQNHDLVFPNTAGKPMDRDNLGQRHFKRLLKKANLPDVKLYALRHTFATLWLESGEHPKILQEILGHSSIMLTLDTYSHVIPHMQKEAYGRFGQMLS